MVKDENHVGSHVIEIHILNSYLLWLLMTVESAHNILRFNLNMVC